MIAIKTSMKCMPGNCKECGNELCPLPLNKNRDTLVKKYLTKRHEECPLVEIGEGENGND